MDMNRTELEELFEKIKDILEYFDKYKIDKCRYILFLGNGDKLSYNIPKESIPHLLGIDTNHLISTGLYKPDTAYNVLLKFIESSYEVWNKRNILNFKAVFSSYTKEKVDNFIKNLEININDTELVCKYQSKRAYTQGYDNEKFDYAIIKKYDDGRIGIIYLVNNGIQIVPMSNQIYENLEEASDKLKEILENQEITLLTGCSKYNTYTDNKANFNLNLNSKEMKIQNIQNYKKQFNSIIDLTGECTYFVGQMQDRKNDQQEDSITIQNILSGIRNRSIIDTNSCGNLIEIANAFNDLITDSDIGNGEAKVSFTKQKEELEELKSCLINLDEQVKQLEKENSGLKKENVELKNSNIELSTKQEEIIKILTNTKTL